MSGPKIDYAEIERQRRIELERIRRERIRKIKEATDNLIHTQERIQKTIKNIQSDFSFELTFCSEIIKEEIKQIKSCAIDDLNGILAVKSIPAEAEEIEHLDQLLITAFNKAYGDTYLKQANRIKTIIHAEYEFESNDEKIRREFDFSNLKKDTVDEMNDVSFEDVGENQISEVTVYLETIKNLVNNDDAINREDKKQLLAVKQDILNSINCTFDVQSAIFCEADLLLKKVTYNTALFNDVYRDYYAEYTAFIKEYNKSRRNKFDNLPKEKYQFKNIEQLESELSMVRIRSRKLSEQNYIRKQLDEVMRELGYHMSEELVFNSSNVGQHLICKSGSDSTALHVHIADTNNVMIEVVGYQNGTKDAYDNIVTSDELTCEERETLLQTQSKFCELHPVICEKLKSRGIVFSKISHKTPNLKYCKKVIINTGEEPLADDVIINKIHRESNDSLLARLALSY